MARERAQSYGRPMFRTIVVGYDEPERGGEAIALAETLRDPRHGSLLLTSAYLPTRVPAAPFVVGVDLRDPTESSLSEARAQLEGRVPVRTISPSPRRPPAR